MSDMIKGLFDFLDSSPTCFHAAKNVADELDAAGYTRLWENEEWKLKNDGKYYALRGQSAVVAFRTPEKRPVSFLLAAAHTDSPCFKIRQNCEVPSAGDTVRLSVEGYGGMVMRSWMDRPLSVAGRIFVKEKNGLASKLVCIDRDLLVIPGLAIHMNREMNKGVELKANVDMLPLFSGKGKNGAFLNLIAETAGVSADAIVSTELFLYPRTPATLFGLQEEFIAAPRIDDLECAWGCLQGFLKAKKSQSMPVCCLFNNEEVGSGTRQGADSTFLDDVLRRVCASLGMTHQEYYAAAAQSFMVSADNGHAIHPAHPEYADGSEFPVLNGGIVIKYNAAQKYATDGLSGALFTEVCKMAGVPFQRYSNRADLPGGSTLGHISCAHLSVPTADVGLPQLAMHSCCETAGARDIHHFVKALTVYYGLTLRRKDDRSVQFE